METQPASGAVRLRVALIWSEEDLAGLDDSVTAVVPLSPRGFVACEEQRRHRVLQAEEFLGDSRPLNDEMYASLRELETAICKSSAPWQRSFSGLEMVSRLGMFFLWDRLLESLPARFGVSSVEVIPPLLFRQADKLDPSAWDFRMARSLMLCVRAHARTGRISLGDPSSGHPSAPTGSRAGSPLRLHLKAWLGKAVAVCAPVLMRSPAGSGLPGGRNPRVDILLAGVQLGDGAHQAPLARRLHERYGERFRWLSMVRRRGDSGLVPEEIRLLDAATDLERYWDNSDEVPRLHWIHRRLGWMAEHAVAWHWAGILGRTLKIRMTREDWYEWVQLGEYKGVFGTYQRWHRYLEQASPRLIIAFSRFQDMAHIAEWSAEKGIPLVLLPHGVIFPSGFRHQTGDYIGTFGRTMKQQFVDTGCRGERVGLCGALYFAHPERKPAEPRRPRGEGRPVFLLPGTFTTLPFFPSSLRARCRQIETLCQAAAENGATLRIREHPRGGRGYLRPYSEAFAKRSPGAVDYSTEPSLLVDLEDCVAVLTTHFDGAALTAMLAGVLVISYVGPDDHEPTVALLEQVGTLARDEQTLGRLIRSFLNGGEELHTLQTRQEAFLGEYVSNVEGDPWAGAEQLVAQAVAECLDSNSGKPGRAG
jgi:hypothetical protein